MKKLALLLLLVGLALAPVYWIYLKFYTGSEAAMVPLMPQATAPALARTWQSAPFQLNQSMAPVGLILHAEGHFSPNMAENRPPRDSYSATLQRDGTAAQPLPFSLGVKHVTDSNPAFKEHLVFMQQVQPGTYTLTVQQAAEPAIVIDRMQLQVRQNLREPDPNIVMAGIVCLVIAILGLILG